MPFIHDLRIIFFGTPDFAVASLDALVQAGAQVVAVVTATDKPAGRGKALQPSAVKEYAVAHNLLVLQPEKMKRPEFLEQLKDLRADLQVVVAFRMMPVEVWDMPPLGTYNVHGSLLPQYRGAAPINRAIMNGETVTGVTTFKLKHEIDTGDILLQQEVPILPTDDAGTMHDKLMLAGASLIVTTLKGIAAGTLKEHPQILPPGEVLKTAPKIFKEDMEIQWASPAVSIHNFVRGLSPYPAAHTYLQGKLLKVFGTSVEVDQLTVQPGTMETDGRTYLRFAAADGWVFITEMQQEGKKRMDVAAFLRGFRVGAAG